MAVAATIRVCWCLSVACTDTRRFKMCPPPLRQCSICATVLATNLTLGTMCWLQAVLAVEISLFLGLALSCGLDGCVLVHEVQGRHVR